MAQPISFADKYPTLIFKAPFTAVYRQAVKKNEVAKDTGILTYKSSNGNIATVNNKGVVTLKKFGEVDIIATKKRTSMYKKSTAIYTLIIEKYRPADKNDLVLEIRKAIKARGNTVNLNYIDTSAITDMSFLFSSDEDFGYGISAFNGYISEWNVRNVTNMHSMFKGATAFNRNIDTWEYNIHKEVKDFDWWGITDAFKNSGLAEGQMPTWCQSEILCRERQE